MNIKIIGKDRSVRFDANAGERILQAGLRNGFALPYECGSGTCGACRASLIQGEVDDLWPEAPGRKYLKSGAGELLMCQHAAKKDCVIQLRRNLPEAGQATPVPREHGGVLIDVVSLTHDVMRFGVELRDPCSFLAGQFMLVGLPGLQGARAYSMVNFSQSARTLEFVIKKKPGGGFSDRMFGNRPAGVPVTLFGPLGAASFEVGVERNLLCIAGGTGIAGIMSILGHAASSDHLSHHRADVFFGVRTSRDVFFLRELGALVERFPESVAVTIALSDEPVPTELRERNPSLRFEMGFVHEAASRAMAGRYDRTRAYLAGTPLGVEAAIRMLLLEARLPTTEIRYDKFG
ncbi:2Fe-2S iron-sulfur cluster binding domain-containing protein [Sulfuritalea sp.]|uniref:2Fe-2S iron-sulfur cluster binding domain-containing protein n=1 Tax=Sulfuritalea sp. TaxID=2480090 RepID=UPI00286E3695|nr:2Fe-2S iron-sulfur cluster binding domain-containing protein [Sulfuritalea sp.]